ncbi:MAG: hypothetical protein HQL91_11515 [Magnetococcales bacterium]|nr:hypothetical protein [Magnetococcales bacterium]
MMIASSTAAVVSFSTRRAVEAGDNHTTGSGFGADYQLDLSSEGLALANSATGITESKMRNVLTRILLETLFGVDASSDPHKQESAEEEMVREVVADPLTEEALQTSV